MLRPRRYSQGHSTARPSLDGRAVLWPWEERHGHGMASLNQTRPHCVNQRGKTHSRLLAARHGRGTAWPRHGNAMLCVNRPLQDAYVYTRGCDVLLGVHFSQVSRTPNARSKVRLERKYSLSWPWNYCLVWNPTVCRNITEYNYKIPVKTQLYNVNYAICILFFDWNFIIIKVIKTQRYDHSQNITKNCPYPGPDESSPYPTSLKHILSLFSHRHIYRFSKLSQLK